MSNTEMNRQIVQEGLERKKNARRQRIADAAHDAAERQLRTTINQRSQEHRDAIEAADRAARLAARSKAEAVAARRRKQATNTIVKNIAGFLGISALVGVAAYYGLMAMELSIPLLVVGLTVTAFRFGMYVERAKR